MCCELCILTPEAEDIFHRNYHKQTFNSIIEFTACSQTKRKSLHARILIEKFPFREMAAKKDGALPIKSSFRVTRTSASLDAIAPDHVL